MSYDEEVAPHAGAWIETTACIIWELRKVKVAPHAGAWIETLAGMSYSDGIDSRAPRGRVD